MLETLRFSYESHLFGAIRQRIGMVPLMDFAKANHLLEMRRQDLLGDAIRVTADLVPEIHAAYQSCLDAVGGGFAGDLFIQQSPDYNASVFAHGDRFDIVIHSSLVRDFCLDELRFVFGHELGHVIFKHSLFPVKEILPQAAKLDQPLTHLLLRWSRASEISADRIGMLCCGRLGVAATALFKTSSGLPNIDVDRVLRSFRAQFEDLEKQILGSESRSAWVRTHPMMPIRFKALELAALDIVALGRRTGGFSAKGFQCVDHQISAIMEALDVSADAR